MEPEIVRTLYNVLPVCFRVKEQSVGAWGISWQPPKDLQDFFPKIASCPKMQELIAKRCQEVLNTGIFNIEEVELKFYKHGFGISVSPGNACDIFVLKSRFSTHNIDNASQCYALHGFFIIMLREIFEMIVLWTDNPMICIEGEPKDRSCRIKRSMSSKPFRLWKVDSFCDDLVTELVWARDAKEAGKLLNLSTITISPLTKDDGLNLSCLKIFEIEVNYQDPELCPPKKYNVLADNTTDAELEVEIMILRQPAFSPLKSVKAINKGESPGRMIFTRVGN